MPSLVFRDSFGTATITSIASPMTFANWVPDVQEIGDRQVGLGTGTSYLFRFRVDFTATFEMTHIPASALGDLHRLKRWLVSGGLVTINTEDAASRVYTCMLKPGETPAWALDDRTNLWYRLTLAVRNVAPYPMLCDYSALAGPTANLIVNGGGETGTVGVQAPNWTNELGDALTPTTAAAIFDARSLTTHSTASNRSRNSQATALVSGTRYLLSGWIKTSAMSAGTVSGEKRGAWLDMVATVTVVARGGDVFNASSEADVGVAADGQAHDWRHVWSLFDLPTAGGNRMLCNVVTGEAADAWFDGIRLEPVPAA